MKKKLACVAALGLMAAGMLVAQTTRPTKAKIQVEAIALEVNRLALADDRKLFSVSSGGQRTVLKLLISLPERNIIGTDFAACKLTSFTDEKGTDLSSTPSSGSRPGWLGSGAYISKDGHACSIWLRSDQAPARGSTKLTINAKLGLRCGADETTYTEKVALKVGSQINFPPVPMKIRTIEETRRPERKMTIRLNHTNRLDVVRKLTFLGPNGKEIKHIRLSTDYSGTGAKRTYLTSYGLAEKVDSVTLKITYYAKVESVAVPVDISVGVGL